MQLNGPEKTVITLKPRHLSPPSNEEIDEGEEEEDDEPEVSLLQTTLQYSVVAVKLMSNFLFI